MNVSNNKSYISNCNRRGILAADEALNSVASDPLQESTHIHETTTLPLEILGFKEILLSNWKTGDQRHWLSRISSYLQFYYNLIGTTEMIEEQQDIIEQNHPILTNGPGGCGKSWLVSQLRAFLNYCVPDDAVPITAVDTEHHSGVPDLYIEDTDAPAGRFGKLAILAPSGVAAAICGGFTIHFAMRCGIINIKNWTQEPTDQQLQGLAADFFRVKCIVIDEFSMVPLALLAYLDRLLRKLRPRFANIFFGAIPAIITGDAFRRAFHYIVKIENGFSHSCLPAKILQPIY